jgi:putative transcriptional regulator
MVETVKKSNEDKNNSQNDMELADENDINGISNSIKVMRVTAGWTQEELAKKVGVTRQTITSIENKKKLPSTTLLLAIAGVFLFAATFNPVLKSVVEVVNIQKILKKIIK